MKVTHLPVIACSLLVLGGCGGSKAPVSGAPTTGTHTEVQSDEHVASNVRIVQSRLIYLPDQTGGNFHTALILLRNDSDETVLEFAAQLSILDKGGRLVKSVDPFMPSMRPHEEALIVQDAIDLPKALPDGRLKLTYEVTRTAAPVASPVTFSNVRYKRDSIVGCSITGNVANQFTQRKENLLVRVAGFVGSDLVTGGYAYVDTVFPKTDATFDINLFSRAECPPRLDRIEVLPNLSEDKLYNP